MDNNLVECFDVCFSLNRTRICPEKRASETVELDDLVGVDAVLLGERLQRVRVLLREGESHHLLVELGRDVDGQGGHVYLKMILRQNSNSNTKNIGSIFENLKLYYFIFKIKN